LVTTRPRLHRRLVKDDCFAETRTPSLDEYPLTESPPPYPRLYHRWPASNVLSPSRPTPGRARFRLGWLDPAPS
jgi:hypothetical protein